MSVHRTTDNNLANLALEFKLVHKVADASTNGSDNDLGVLYCRTVKCDNSFNQLFRFGRIKDRGKM